jgi:Putative prokaryotic signal transducing protein
MDPQELVPIASYSETTHAEVVRNALEAEGIRSVVEGPNQGAFTGAVQVRVLVQAADAERARAFVEEHEGRK